MTMRKKKHDRLSQSMNQPCWLLLSLILDGYVMVISNGYPIFMIGVTQLLMIFNDSNYNFWITPIKKWLTNC